MVRLMPCRRCGGTADIDVLGSVPPRYVVRCHTCGEVTDAYGNYEDAVNAWERRNAPDRKCMNVSGSDTTFVCSACGRMSVTTIFGYAGMLPRHCPWCGARVIKEGE